GADERKLEWSGGGVTAGHEVMEGRAERIEIGSRVGLRAAVLLRRRIARAAVEQRILRGAFLESPRDPEVDQLDRAVRLDHDVGGLHVAEDDRRLLAVEIVEHVRELHSPVQRVQQWEWTAP